jgi:hypothetical protein
MTTDVGNVRDRMVESQIARRGIRDRRVLAAMRRVPREAFVDEGFQEFAYEDSPLPIGESQTISQPYIVALMLEAAEIGEGDRVLEAAPVRAMPRRWPRRSPGRSAPSSGTPRWLPGRSNASAGSGTAISN